MRGITPANRPSSDSPSYFNVKYGKASASITGSASTIIATTQGAFHGMSIITISGEACQVTVYDSTGSASGNIVGQILIGGGSAVGTQWDLNTPTIAKYGLVAVKTGTSSQATVFYGPKG